MLAEMAPGPLAHDINSVLSIPLVAHDAVVGALSVYSHRANAFDADTVRLVLPLADYAGEVIGSSPLYAYSIDMAGG